MQLKACGNENKEIRKENAKLHAKNMELKQRMLEPIRLRCQQPYRPSQFGEVAPAQ